MTNFTNSACKSLKKEDLGINETFMQHLNINEATLSFHQQLEATLKPLLKYQLTYSTLLTTCCKE